MQESGVNKRNNLKMSDTVQWTQHEMSALTDIFKTIVNEELETKKLVT
jgi:hypothetical protein